MGSITLREKMKYLTFKTSTPLTTFTLLGVRTVRAARSVTQTMQIYKLLFN